MFERILVATDGSLLAQKAVDGAMALARQNGAELLAITVVPRYPTSYLEGATSHLPDEIARAEKQWADSAQATLDDIVEAGAACGVKVKTTTINSDHVADSVLAAARKHGSDLIVMASHGRKGLKKLLLGSQTQQVLNDASMPVLVLR